MPVPTDITAGTISISGSTVTGVGTSFEASDIRQGDLFIWIEGGAGQWSPIVQTVTSNTVLTLAEPWTGPTISGARYRLRYQWDSSRVSAQSRQLIEMLDNGNVLALAGLTGPGVPVFDGPHSMTIRPEADFINGVAYNVQVDTLADRAAYDGQAAGYSVLVSDVGDGRSAVYSKASNTSGDWTDPAYITGGVGPTPDIEATVANTAPGTTPTVTPVPITGGTRLDFTLPAAEGFYNAGVYDIGTAYTQDQVVRHNGSSFIALQAVPAGTSPSSAFPPIDTAFWQVLATRGANGLGTVTEIVAGTNIAVDNTDPTAPVISSTSDVSFVQLQNFYATLAMEQAEDRLTGPVVAGPDGNGIFDGFNTAGYIDGSFSSGMDLSVSGEIRPALSASDVVSVANNSNQTDYVNFNHRFRIASSQISSNGSKVRLQLVGVSSGSSTFVSAMWMGHRAASGNVWDMDGTQVQITRGGLTTFTIPSGMTVFSDWVDFSLTNTRDLIVSAHTSSGDIRCKSVATSNFDWWTKVGGSEAGLNAPTGYTQSGSYDIGMIASVQVGAPGNLVVRSSQIALSEAPTKARLFAFLTLGGGVINTDLVFDISRNDGGAFTSVPMNFMYQRPGAIRVYSSDPVDIVTPTGVAGRWRLRTFNTPQIRLLAVGVMLEG